MCWDYKSRYIDTALASHLVGVDHEQVRGEADLRAAAHLAEDVADRGVVVEVSEGLVGLPDVALDVVVKLRSFS